MKLFRDKRWIIAMIFFTIFIAACTPQEEASTQEKAGQINKSLSMKLSLEQGVIAGQVFLKNDIATAKIVADPNMAENQFQELAQRYVEILKEHYESKKVNVQGIQNNETVIDLFMEH